MDYNSMIYMALVSEKVVASASCWYGNGFKDIKVPYLYNVISNGDSSS